MKSMTRFGLDVDVRGNEIQYSIGKGFGGFFRARRLRQQLREEYFHISSQGHVTPFLIPFGYPADPHGEKLVVVGFLGGGFFSGRYFFIENLDDRRVTRYTHRLKDICDALE